MKVSEVFGPTIQGEGPSSGRRAGFVRLGGCNLSCVWCDTPYTWDWSGKNGTAYDPATELHDDSADNLIRQICDMNVPLAVITGGEPTSQPESLRQLALGLVATGHTVEIETNGTRTPHPELLANPAVHFNVSPKLANSGEPYHRRVNLDAIQHYAQTGRAVFKFVVCEPSDLDEVDSLMSGVTPEMVWLMPQGTTTSAVASRTTWLAEQAIARGYNLSSRLHVLVWGDKRGV